MSTDRPQPIRTALAALALAIAFVGAPRLGVGETSPVETGRVVDDAGQPLSGATVIVTRDLVPDANAAQISTTAVTAADGSFVVADVPPGTADVAVMATKGYPALHEGVDIAPGTNRSTLALVKPTAGERAWLARINAERAAFGVGPVVFDQGAMRSARYWAGYMAHNGYFAHTMPNADQNASTPGDETPVTRYLKFSGLNLDASNGMSENIAEVDGDASWNDAEDLFMDERTKCPHGKPAGCAYSEATGHFLNILNPQFKWVGLGVSVAHGESYYDQEFIVGA